MWRCLNDFFAYSEGQPKPDPHPYSLTFTGIDGLTYHYDGFEPHCKRDPTTCGLYRTASETLPKATSTK
jgi:hypothetical protein